MAVSAPVLECGRNSGRFLCNKFCVFNDTGAELKSIKKVCIVHDHESGCFNMGKKITSKIKVNQYEKGTIVFFPYHVTLIEIITFEK